MRQDLDALCDEIERALGSGGLAVFRARARDLSSGDHCEWDVEEYGDFREFLAVASQLGCPAIVFHRRKLSAPMLESAGEQLEMAGLPREEQREHERMLQSLRGYEGFVCAIELSFDHNGRTYVYSVTAPWFDDLADLMDRLEDSLTGGDGDEEDGALGGYYSRN